MKRYLLGIVPLLTIHLSQTRVLADTINYRFVDSEAGVIFSLGTLTRTFSPDGDVSVNIRTQRDFPDSRWRPTEKNILLHSRFNPFPPGSGDLLYNAADFQTFADLYVAGGNKEGLQNPLNPIAGRQFTGNAWEVQAKNRKTLSKESGVRKVTWIADLTSSITGNITLDPNVTVERSAEADIAWKSIGTVRTSIPLTIDLMNVGMGSKKRSIEDQMIREVSTGNFSLEVSPTSEEVRTEFGISVTGERSFTIPDGGDLNQLFNHIVALRFAKEKARDCSIEEFIQVENISALSWNFVDRVQNASITTSIDVENLEVRGTPCTVPNSKSKSTFGSFEGVKLNYDASSKELLFSDSVIDTLNLNGSDSGVDPLFKDDPFLGATISVSEFQFLESFGNGFIFEGGSLEVKNGNTSLLSADIPILLVDDLMKEEFGNNMIGSFDNIFINESSGSDFLNTFKEDIFSSLATEFFGLTDMDITSMISSGTSFETSVSIHGSHSTVPEPSTILSLLTIGGIALGTSKKKQS